LIYNYFYYRTIHNDYKKSLKLKKQYYKNNIELFHAIENDEIKEFQKIKDKYHTYIKAKLGYSKRYIDKQSMKYSKKQYDRIKNTNQF